MMLTYHKHRFSFAFYAPRISKLASSLCLSWMLNTIEKKEVEMTSNTFCIFLNFKQCMNEQGNADLEHAQNHMMPNVMNVCFH